VPDKNFEYVMGAVLLITAISYITAKQIYLPKAMLPWRFVKRTDDPVWFWLFNGVLIFIALLLLTDAIIGLPSLH
jgi:hypothetical protein